MWCFVVFFFFKQKTAYEMRISDWSSDVCSSDLIKAARFTLRRNFLEGPFSGIDIGYNYTERDKKKTSTVFFANLLNGRTPVSVATGDVLNPTALNFVGIPGILAYDPRDRRSTRLNSSH